MSLLAELSQLLVVGIKLLLSVRVLGHADVVWPWRSSSGSGTSLEPLQASLENVEEFTGSELRDELLDGEGSSIVGPVGELEFSSIGVVDL